MRGRHSVNQKQSHFRWICVKYWRIFSLAAAARTCVRSGPQSFKALLPSAWPFGILRIIRLQWHRPGLHIEIVNFEGGRKVSGVLREGRRVGV
jgi:hypothetical protein